MYTLTDMALNLLSSWTGCPVVDMEDGKVFIPDWNTRVLQSVEFVRRIVSEPSGRPMVEGVDCAVYAGIIVQNKARGIERSRFGVLWGMHDSYGDLSYR